MNSDFIVLFLFSLPLIMGVLFILYIELWLMLPPVSTKKVGGLKFVKIGRFCFSYCISSNPRPFHP